MKPPWLPLSLFLLTLLTRILFACKFLYHMDSVYFAARAGNCTQRD